MTVPFNALVGEDFEQGGQDAFGAFEVMVAVPPEQEVTSLRITDAQGRRTFAAIQRSKPPSIRLIFPRKGASLAKRTTVAWVVRDPDTSVAQLLYQVAYSPDGGQSWVPIAVDVPGTKRFILFDATEIQPSKGNGVIRVFVSDGLNTAFADVSKLSTPHRRRGGQDDSPDREKTGKFSID
jgi:hypothetical protein